MKFNYEGLSLKSGIYKIVNTHTNRIYIGSSHEFKSRWYNGHAGSLRTGKHQNKFLQADFNKCKEALGGTDDFLEFHIIQLMEGSTKEERKIVEQIWIDKYFDNGKLCYNLKKKTSVSRENTPSKNPEETHKKQSKSMIAVWQNPLHREKVRRSTSSIEVKQKMRDSHLGRTLPLEQRKKISESNKGRVVSLETRRLISEANLGRKATLKARKNMSMAHKGKPNNQLGTTHSFEAKKKISEAQIGNTKRAKTYDIALLSPDGAIYSCIENLAKFARCHNLHVTDLHRVILGARRTCKGWRLQAQE